MGYNVALVFIAVVQLGASGILAIAHNWNLGLVIVLAGLPPMVSSGWLKIRSDAKLDRHTSKRYSSSASIASEAIAAIRTVSSLAIERSVLDKYTLELDNAVEGSKAQLFRTMFWFALTQGIEYWFMALGFWWVRHGGLRGDIANWPSQVRLQATVGRRCFHVQLHGCVPGRVLRGAGDGSNLHVLVQYAAPSVSTNSRNLANEAF